MIRYALACEGGHAFESWFPGSEAYDDQTARGLVACPVCGSQRVEKAIMAPALNRARGSEPERSVPTSAPGVEQSPTTEPAVPAPQGEASFLAERDRGLREMMREMRRRVTAQAEHVGPRFADQARAMHEGDIPHRSIYGEASREEARALVEEGVEFHPLPVLPDDRN